MGSGGVGAFFGAKLALAGHNVTFIARGPHLAAMQKDGLTITSTDGDIRLETVNATDDPSDLDTADVILFTPKLYDTIAASEQIKHLVGPQTIIVTLQNGVSSPDMIAGVVGELNGTMSNRAQAFENVCKEAEIDIKLTDQIELEMWRKFIPLTVMSGLTSVIRGPIGEVLDDPDLAQMMHDAIAEVVAVGNARGVPIGDATEQVMEGIKSAPRETMSSMSLDLLRGKKMERPWLSAKVAEFGEEAGVATPTHHFMASVLRRFQNGAPE
jgi:2-dehydropantoate 2-reductase